MDIFDSLMDWLPSMEEVKKSVSDFFADFGVSEIAEVPKFEGLPEEAPSAQFNVEMPEVKVPDIPIPEVKIEDIKNQYSKGPEQFQSWFGGLEPETQRAVFTALQSGAGAALGGLRQRNDQEMRREEEDRRREDTIRRGRVAAPEPGQYAPRTVPGGLIASRMGGG